MSEGTAQILSKNIWELERRIKEGQGDQRTRLSLLRAYAQQVAVTEDRLGIPPEHRSFLKVNDHSRDGVLLLHGSTGSPAQLRSLAEHLWNGGFSVFAVRLAGHPASDEELDTTSWRACLVDAENRYRVLSIYCRHLYVVGFSFGATLALHMNVRPRPRAMALLAPALHVKLNIFARILLALGAHKLRWFRKRQGWKGEVLESMDLARGQDWWEGVPVFAAMTKDDYRIDRRSLDHIRKHSSHKETTTVEFPRGGHVFMDEEPAQELRTKVLEFLKQN